MDDSLMQLKKQHVDNYKNAIIDIITNNTNVLVDEDIMSLLRKPPLDSMDLIKSKFLELAKKNEIILNTGRLDTIIDDYRLSLMSEVSNIKMIRINNLTKEMNRFNFDESELFKLNKKDFIKLDKDIKKILKNQLDVLFDNYILKNIDLIFSSDVDLKIKSNIIIAITKYVKGTYQRQLLENFDIKVLIKNTILINSIKEQNDRYLFTINNSRILNDLNNNIEN